MGMGGMAYRGAWQMRGAGGCSVLGCIGSRVHGVGVCSVSGCVIYWGAQGMQVQGDLGCMGMGCKNYWGAQGAVWCPWGARGIRAHRDRSARCIGVPRNWDPRVPRMRREWGARCIRCTGTGVRREQGAGIIGVHAALGRGGSVAHRNQGAVGFTGTRVLVFLGCTGPQEHAGPRGSTRVVRFLGARPLGVSLAELGTAPGRAESRLFLTNIHFLVKKKINKICREGGFSM